MARDTGFAVAITIDGQDVPLADVLAEELARGRVALDLLRDAFGTDQVTAAGERFAEATSLPLLEAVTAQRSALLDLKRDLGDARILEGLRPYTETTQKEMQEWGPTPGQFSAAITEFTVTGLSAREFLGWFHGRSGADDEPAMISSNPEHYRIRAISDPPGQDVIETMGLYGVPLHVLLTFHNDPAVYPEPAFDDHPIRLCATGVFGGDNKDIGVTALHQFKDTADGLHAQLGIYFPTTFPEELVKGHQMHLAIEFHNWLRAAYQATAG